MRRNDRRGVKRIIFFFFIVVGYLSCKPHSITKSKQSGIILSWEKNINELNDEYVSVYIKNNRNDTAILFLGICREKNKMKTPMQVIFANDTIILGNYFGDREFIRFKVIWVGFISPLNQCNFII